MDFMRYLPVLTATFAAVLCVIGFLKWRDFEFNRTFNNFSKRSAFAYEMFTKTNEKNFENLGYEYGVAAFTGDTTLTSTQRARILSVADPVRALTAFKKCKLLINLQETGLTLFEWKKNRHKNNLYRKVLMALYILIGFLCLVSVPIVPVYVSVNYPEFVVNLKNKFTVVTFFQLGLLFLEVISIAIIAMSSCAKLYFAEKLIDENVKASDVILNQSNIPLAGYVPKKDFSSNSGRGFQ
ncbi:hypothetical protein [Cronobacter dublinensis]|uniref:hypothetical protein n=1 Tax=Cronobacter dublinensis TaxID=413497 RepID=UPI000D00D0C6|nr:hypothetical protein [Cronobacter dublinensis]